MRAWATTRRRERSRARRAFAVEIAHTAAAKSQSSGSRQVRWHQSSQNSGRADQSAPALPPAPSPPRAAGPNSQARNASSLAGGKFSLRPPGQHVASNSTRPPGSSETVTRAYPVRQQWGARHAGSSRNTDLQPQRKNKRPRGAYAQGAARGVHRGDRSLRPEGSAGRHNCLPNALSVQSWAG